ncbi:hypothetical protein AZA_79706 [Nitrospirillum viridazoti Y2]|nr:hypothetical protein AZA_79706 [Nitrospirillum amazonense Y2]
MGQFPAGGETGPLAIIGIPVHQARQHRRRRQAGHMPRVPRAVMAADRQQTGGRNGHGRAPTARLPASLAQITPTGEAPAQACRLPVRAYFNG